MTPENFRDCLLPVVGLSPTDYDCSTSVMPEGATDSASGFFLTNCKDGMPIEFSGAIADCSGLWDVLTAARLDGIKNFVADLSVEIGAKYRPIFNDFSGYVGKQDASNAVSNAKRFAAYEIKGRHLQSTLRIKGFKLYSNVAAEVDVTLYSEDDLTTPLETVSVTTVAKKWTAGVFTEEQVFDIWDENNYEAKRYWLVWEIPEGDYARTNEISCGCKGRADQGFKDFIEVQGVSVDAIEDLTATDSSRRTHGSIGMGLAVDMSVSCTMGNYLCGCLNFGIESFATTGIQWVMAKTVQHGGVNCLADAFIKSSNINTYTLLEREKVYGIRAHAQKEYLQGVRYIAENLPEGALQCFECREMRMQTRTLLA